EPPRKAGGKGRRGILADFGEPVTGYLVVGGVAHGPRRILASLALAEDDEGEPFRIVRVPGQEEWSQAETTTFRYVRLWGALPDEIDPVVVEVHPAAAAEDAARREARGVGVFGLEPPRPAGSDGSS
ncbi:MAG: hypothetical protein R3190_16800, partial [Thermoanaerobaculia bacterium]|nr:hypothetical protein [Thermoanaerobaculia bacterium]